MQGCSMVHIYKPQGYKQQAHKARRHKYCELRDYWVHTNAYVPRSLSRLGAGIRLTFLSPHLWILIWTNLSSTPVRKKGKA